MTTQSLAQSFSAFVREYLADHLATINARNVTYGSTLCATHDFCDANLLMAAAFERAMGREIDLDDAADGRLWGDAWDAAKASGFTL